MCNRVCVCFGFARYAEGVAEICACELERHRRCRVSRRRRGFVGKFEGQGVDQPVGEREEASSEGIACLICLIYAFSGEIVLHLKF